ncbi:MAG: hypothetical protein HY007_00665 [Candidatus Sungbacteria bacterium]|nr:hypothetical protein [Candidatus Sungbacteria bacterium]
MSKSSIYRSAIIATSVLIPALAFAQGTPIQGSPNPTQVNTIVTNFTGLARLVITLLFVLALLVFVWGAVRLILAAGDPAKIKEAKSFMWWGVIAMAVLASVFGLITFLQSYFGVTAGGGFTPIIVPVTGGIQ